jgi:membrane fusion protein (multidrug efflux system)
MSNNGKQFRSLARALTALVLIPMLFGCAQEPKAVTAAHVEKPTVAVTRVVSKQLYRELKLPGEILPYQNVPLYPKIPGFIKWIGVDRGSIVKKGQLLCVLIAPELKAQQYEAMARVQSVENDLSEAEQNIQTLSAQLEEAKAKLSTDEVTYERLKVAFATPGIISKNELHVAEKLAEGDRAIVKAREEAIKAAQDRVRVVRQNRKASSQSAKNIEDIEQYLRITAPFDGVITERNQHVGSFAYPPGGDQYPPMLRIKENSLLRIVIPVPEVAVEGVSVGDKINFSVEAFPGQMFSGTVARIAHSLDVKTRTEPVELNCWNPNWKLSPGMFPQVYWPMKRTYPTLFVPSTAVASTLKEPFVIRIRDGRVQPVKVKRGEPMGDMVEVFGDLHEGDVVAVLGTDEMAEGTAVTVSEERGNSG